MPISSRINENAMHAKVWNSSYTRTIKESICYAMMAYMKYANAPSKLQCEFLQHNVTMCVWYMQMRGESPPFKEKWIVRDKRQKIWSRVELESGSNLCAQESSNEKKESVNFWEWNEWRRIKVIFKIKDSSHIGSCAFKV